MATDTQRDPNKPDKVLNFCLMAAVFTSCAILWINGVKQHSIQIADQEGGLSCKKLPELVSNGNHDWLSYNLPGLFAFGEKYNTIAQYEVDNDYSFTQCQETISKQLSAHCEARVQTLKEALFNSYWESTETKSGLCKSAFEAARTTYIPEDFQVRGNVDQKAVKFRGKWVSTTTIEIWDPRLAGPYNRLPPTLEDMGELCISSGGFASCVIYRNLEDAQKAHAKIVEFAYPEKQKIAAQNTQSNKGHAL
ncbi:hypothetical protein [Neptuniibacter sp. QD37_11]|uniref:hypothetical protein n=1 Tax=Neptuniibacter sp. QD37_11 TaxID=3398209 RepID=UPI0039F44A68